MGSLQVLRAERREIRDKIKQLQQKDEALSRAIDVLSGHPERSSNGNGHPPERTRTFKGYVNGVERQQQVLDYLRKHPDDEVSANTFVAAGLMPHSSAGVAIDRLIANGKVKQVGTTPRNKPVVVFKPEAVKPGEKVAS